MRLRCLALAVLAISLYPVTPRLAAQDTDVSRLVAALLGDTPVASDLQTLADSIGGRPTGSPANLAGVEWALQRFRAAGVTARKEAFTMPGLWLERSAGVTISAAGGTIRFAPRIAALPFSTATPPTGLRAPVVDGGRGTAEDFARLGAAANGAFVLIETEALHDLDGLFREYNEAAQIEPRAFAAGVAGVIYQSSRPDGVLARHNASLNLANRHPMVMMERSAGVRILRLLRTGHAVEATLTIDVQAGGPYESYNVIGEIRGATKPEEIVVIGSHFDSWDLGTGVLDNGANAVMLIDVARQMARLGLRPARTIRFVLWNGEEQHLVGSWKYTVAHAAELDKHVMAGSVDIGTGRITGFFTGGRPEIAAAVDRALAPVRGLGPFTQVDAPIVGTDNYDFMMQGVANIVANQESANYGPNYHAASDTYDKADLRTLRENAAIVGAVVWAFANMEVTWGRQSRAEIERLIASTDLEQQMRSFAVWEPWVAGVRGRAR
ncbi:MAG: M28 family peptidase [Gemmatimonadetes bacterium]|nr:M28 family peptidase [Gemmatimonadota bacterium]